MIGQAGKGVQLHCEGNLHSGKYFSIFKKSISRKSTTKEVNNMGRIWPEFVVLMDLWTVNAINLHTSKLLKSHGAFLAT